MRARGRYGEKGRRWIRLEDPDPPNGFSSGFYAIWSRSGRTLIVTLTQNREAVDRAQVSLRPDQVDSLREFIGEEDRHGPDRSPLSLVDEVDEHDYRWTLHAEWSRSGSRLVLTVTSSGSDVALGEVDLHLDQVDELERFLASATSGRR